jgi:hypothetical protein
MQAHEERVIQEKADLDAKIEKLNLFIMSSTTYQFMLEEDKRLLALQHSSMQDYSFYLGRRIERFTP